jgi:hypothetical protein
MAMQKSLEPSAIQLFAGPDCGGLI